MTYRVVIEPEADGDLIRLYEHLLARAEYAEDLDVADQALDAINAAIAALAATPFLFRKADGVRGSLRRELVVPFGGSGYVVAYEIATPELVVVLAVRYQREDDYPLLAAV